MHNSHFTDVFRTLWDFCLVFFKALGSVITFPFRTKNKKEKPHIFGPYAI